MATGTDAYMKTAILTAPPEKLQLMLYDGAIRFANRAAEKIKERNYEASCELLLRAQDIVIELINGLRPELNPSLCGRLAGVYLFVYRRLVEANMNRDAGAVAAAVEVLAIQRNIWLELLDKLAQERAMKNEAPGVPAGA
jgi:flagellar protein FliS